MNKILIIGSKGMLGQELVKVFKSDQDFKVVAWERKDIDVTKEREVMKKIAFTKPAVIINATAYNAVDDCEKSKKELEKAKKINSLAPGYLAKAAKKNKAVLVHYSTNYVFDGNPEIAEPSGCTHVCATCSLHKDFVPEIGFAEDGKPHPVNKYGQTKLQGENEVRKNLKAHYIIRLSRLFGRPAASAGAKKSFFDVMLTVAGKLPNGKKVVRVIDDETDCFTYAPDLAKKTREIIEAEKPFGIYHVTNSGPCSWYEAAKELYRLKKIKVKVEPVLSEEFPRPAARPYYGALLNTKLNPLRSWKEALKEYLKS